MYACIYEPKFLSIWVAKPSIEVSGEDGIGSCPYCIPTMEKYTYHHMRPSTVRRTRGISVWGLLLESLLQCRFWHWDSSDFLLLLFKVFCPNEISYVKYKWNKLENILWLILLLCLKNEIIIQSWKTGFQGPPWIVCGNISETSLLVTSLSPCSSWQDALLPCNMFLPL